MKAKNDYLLNKMMNNLMKTKKSHGLNENQRDSAKENDYYSPNRPESATNQY